MPVSRMMRQWYGDFLDARRLALGAPTTWSAGAITLAATTEAERDRQDGGRGSFRRDTTPGRPATATTPTWGAGAGRSLRAFSIWLEARDDLDWLEVGCGTGALSAAILARAPEKPDCRRSVGGFPRQGPRQRARTRVEFRVGRRPGAGLEAGSRDVVVSALVLNFVPDKDKALAEMRRVARPGADRRVLCLGLSRRRHRVHARLLGRPRRRSIPARATGRGQALSLCTPDGLAELARNAGLASVECAPIVVPAVFKDFEDYWQPFTSAPGRRRATA